MKIVLCSDFHFGTRKNSEVFLESQIKFIVEQLVPYLKNNDIKNLFLLGDLFDNRSSTNIKIMNSVHDIFENHLKDFNVFVIIGNHDTYFSSSIEINSLKILSNFSNVHLIEKITTIELNNKKIIMVPWIVDNVEFIKEFTKLKCDVCLGHFNINGFHYNKFKSSEDGIQGKIFNNCKKVFTGHFHIRNSQNILGSEIIYIGSPYQLTRNDIDENRGFVVLDLNDLKHNFIDNEISLKYIKLKYPENFTKSKIKNNIIDVHIDYNDSYNENDVEKYIKKLEEYHPAMTPNIFVENNSQIDGNIDINCYNIGSMLNLIREYINSLDIKNKEEIYENLIELYNSVKGDNI